MNKRVVTIARKRYLWTVFVLFSVFLTISSTAWAESWNRAVSNSSSQPVTITVDADMGNVWFTNACTTENGPCTINPGQRADTTFTTTKGIANGTFRIKHGTKPECTYTYWGATPHYAPAVKFWNTNCPSNIIGNVAGWDGYMEIKD